jgi:GNAT superfamily N-acetyltransferase
MTTTRRYTYYLDLAELGDPAGIRDAAADAVRQPHPDDLEALAELMLSAYRGTIDDDGETLEDAIREVRSFFDGAPLLEASLVAEDRAGLRSACLVSRYDGSPLVAYVMTRPGSKGRGHAGRLLRVLAAITDGNTPSERLFRRLGFTRIG